MNESDAFGNILKSMMRHRPIVDDEDKREGRKYDEAAIEMVCFVFSGEMPKVLKGWAPDFFRDAYRPRLKLALSETLEAISAIYGAMGKK